MESLQLIEHMTKEYDGKIKAILIDDEKAALESLQKKIQLYIPDVEVLDTAINAKEGLQSIHKHQPDLVFLDIEMPWMNGFEMLDCLGTQIDFSVVFVTAYDQYAIKAFKTVAIDYLLKPVDKDDLILFIEKYKSEHRVLDKEQLGELTEQLNQPKQHNRLLIKGIESIDVLDTDDILCCQADSNYSYIYTTDGRKIIATKTLNSLEQMLDKTSFVRIHRSYIINLLHVTQFSTSDGYDVMLKNGQKYPVSRRKKDDFLDLLGSFNTSRT